MSCIFNISQIFFFYYENFNGLLTFFSFILFRGRGYLLRELIESLYCRSMMFASVGWKILICVLTFFLSFSLRESPILYTDLIPSRCVKVSRCK